MASIPHVELFAPQSSCTSEGLATGRANQESPRLCPRPPGGSLLSQDLMRCQDEWASIDKFPYGCDTWSCCAASTRNQRFPYEPFPIQQGGYRLGVMEVCDWLSSLVIFKPALPVKKQRKGIKCWRQSQHFLYLLHNKAALRHHEAPSCIYTGPLCWHSEAANAEGSSKNTGLSGKNVQSGSAFAALQKLWGWAWKTLLNQVLRIPFWTHRWSMNLKLT